jgi:hypothetical protein
MMKKITLLFTFFLLTCTFSNAQTTINLNPDAAWSGFMNVFELDCSTFVFNSPWGVPDLKTVLTSGTSITLQPNFNGWDDNPTDPFWVQQPAGPGNKCMEAATNIVDNTLIGQNVTFTGEVTSNDLDGAYTAIAFIRVFNGDFSVLIHDKQTSLPVGTFSVSATDIETGAGANIQYGFVVTGPNQTAANAAAVGSIVMIPATLGLEDFQTSSFKTFPNPTQNSWTVKTKNQEISSIQIFNILGKNVMSLAPNADEVKIDASSLTKGLYFATITTNMGRSTKKLIKN